MRGIIDLLLGWSRGQVFVLALILCLLLLSGCSVFTEQAYFGISVSPYPKSELEKAKGFIREERFMDFEVIQDECSPQTIESLRTIYKFRNKQEAPTELTRIQLLDVLGLTSIACLTDFQHGGAVAYYDSRLKGRYLKRARDHETAHALEAYIYLMPLADMVRHDHYRY